MAPPARAVARTADPRTGVKAASGREFVPDWWLAAEALRLQHAVLAGMLVVGVPWAVVWCGVLLEATGTRPMMSQVPLAGHALIWTPAVFVLLMLVMSAGQFRLRQSVRSSAGPAGTAGLLTLAAAGLWLLEWVARETRAFADLPVSHPELAVLLPWVVVARHALLAAAWVPAVLSTRRTAISVGGKPDRLFTSVATLCGTIGAVGSGVLCAASLHPSWDGRTELTLPDPGVTFGLATAGVVLQLVAVAAMRKHLTRVVRSTESFGRNGGVRAPSVAQSAPTR